MKLSSISKKIALFASVTGAAAFIFAALNSSTPVNAAKCVDGNQSSNFTGTVVSKDTISFRTENGGLLCEDVQVNVTSFSLPLTYNGKGFSNNPTAIPQYKYANKTVTLKKGTDGAMTVTVAVPDECTPHQIDAYLGPVLKEILTSKGVNVNGRVAIVGKVFNKTKDDCSEPIKVCDTKTGTVVTITKQQAEANPERYVDKNSDKCKVKTCDTSTGTIVMVERGKENTSPYSTDLSKCKVTVCDIETKSVVTINKHEALSNPSRYVDKNDERCKDKVTVCDAKTGDIVTITREQAEADKERYVDATSDKCADVPEEIPSTGPVEILSGITGVGALAGSTSMYVRSRRALKQ